MEKILNDYLARVERYLKPLSASDRVDIVKEIKSEMLELLGAGVAPEQIVERLGDAKTLARAYLSDNVAKAHGWRRVSALIAFYSLAGLGGICVLPVTSICAAAEMPPPFLRLPRAEMVSLPMSWVRTVRILSDSL